MARNRSFGFIALSPAGTPEPAIAVAGSRAGDTGILNLEFCTNQDAALVALASLAAHGRGRFGVLLDGQATDLLAAVLAQPHSGFELVVLTASEAGCLGDAVAAVHGSGRHAYVVATSLDEAQVGQAAGADAIIAKGHEAGGWVGEETAFVLLQRLLPHVDVPVWVQGGVGLHTAAACLAGGAAGVVLDGQLLLAKESPLSADLKQRIGAMDGSETARFGAALGAAFRAYARPDLPAVDELRRVETAAVVADQPLATAAWRSAMRERVNWQAPEHSVLAIGQDAAFAAGLARRFGTVGGILAGIREAARDHCATARRQDPLAEQSALARSHGTRYPIVQGPMTRVSDRAEFADAVAGAGGLPFLALALMRGSEVRSLLEETRYRLGDRPWGVGILGFVPPELRAEQLAAIRDTRPPFALIAGGRPDQARLLEGEGIPTYLHVPSPGLLRLFLRDGAKRFVFEGRECGGHVGPRTSFVLWETMVEALLDSMPKGADAAEYHILFAGGIHDGLSAAMVAALAAPLVERGVRIGVLLGTAYLFTREAVESGAITPGFQQAAVSCDRTVLLESGPGHATRCAPSPFVDDFGQEKRRLLQQGLPADELRNALEVLNIGRLRIASKGVDRDPRFADDPTVPKLAALDAAAQWSRGMYMIGQVAALRTAVSTIEDLHHEVAAGSTQRLERVVDDAVAPLAVIAEPTPPQAAVAIVGMGCIVPGAPDLRTFWANVLNKVDAVTEVPLSRWDWRRYYDPDRASRDKIYSRWGGFVADVPFDPVQYGMPPSTLRSIEPFQLLGLAVVRAALEDAGYLERPFARERTSVMLGAGGGGGDLSSGYVVRSSLPALFGESATSLTDRLAGALPEWTEDSFAGLLMNVAAGRVANRFDFGGVNFTIDAACASSLAAVYQAVRDLEAHTSDVVIAGGVDAIENPFAFLCFSKTQALSPTGRCRPFDAQADGIAISEGFAALVLKRLADAERDGDRIYAVIRGVGGSSDGRDRSLTAPRPEGQVRALRRAYAQAGFSPATVGLIEAHGTGTVAGDQAEVTSLTRFFDEAGATRQTAAIGSVKSMIGHTKATAGVAGLIKVALALHHRVLPATLGVTQPNPKANFPASPFYVNAETRPWIHDAESQPRRAGASAFGFGGTNFHVVAEEYTGGYLPDQSAVVDPWPAELFVWRGGSRADLLAAVRDLLGKLEQGAEPRLADLAHTVTRRAGAAQEATSAACTLAVVAESVRDLADKLQAARRLLEAEGPVRQHGPQGVHFSAAPFLPEGKLAFLFPGQGSQYVNMAREIAIAFPEVRACFEQADRVLAGKLEQPLSRYVVPPPAFNADEERQQQAALTETNVAQPALGATDVAYLRLLRSFGVEPQLVAGHSYGEFVALHAAGCFDDATLWTLSEARGRFIREGAAEESGTMAAVDAAPDTLQPLLALDPALTLANLNAPRQTVISGTRAGVERALAWCKEQKLRARLLPVACAFHSPLVAPAQQRLAGLLRQVGIDRPRMPVFSNTTAAAYSDDPQAIADLLSEHLVRPVEFVREVEAMYEAGARVFVEVGPRAVLGGLVERILGDRPFAGVALDQPGRSGLVQLLHGLAALVSEGVPVQTDRLFQGRSVRLLNLTTLQNETGRPRHTPTTWLVNGGGARPANQTPQSGAAPPLPVPIAVLDSTPAARALPAEPATNGAPPLGDRAGLRPGRDLLAAPIANGTPTPPLSTPEAGGMATGPARAGAEAPNGAPERRPSPATPPYVQATMSTTPANGSGSRPMSITKEEDGMAQVIIPNSHPPGAPAPPAPVVPAHNGSTVAAPPRFAVGRGDRAAETMHHFQQVMQQFLNTQRAVMLAYLGSPEAATPGPAAQPLQLTGAAGDGHAPQMLAAGPTPGGTGLPGLSALAPPAPAAVPVAAVAAASAPAAPITSVAPSVMANGHEGAAGVSAASAGTAVAPRREAVPPAPQPQERVTVVLEEVRPAATAATATSAVEVAAPTGAIEISVAVAAPAGEAPASAASALDRQQLIGQLLAVVSDRTGYPPEMLALDADMEADLGIDSIKRVEIAGTILGALPLPPGDPPDMEKLAGSRTLGEVVDNLQALLAPPRDTLAPAAATNGIAKEDARRPFDSEPADPSIGRFVLQATPLPPAVQGAGLARTGTVVVVDDETGVGARLAEQLGDQGFRVVRVVGTAAPPTGATPALAGDLSSPADVTRVVTQLHDRHGPAAALIHLAALRTGAGEIGLDPEAWGARLASDLQGLFLLAQALRADLEDAAAAGGAAVVAATALGGAFAVDQPPGDFFAGQGSIAGFLKALAQEWPAVRVKAMDVSPTEPATMAGWVLAELHASDGIVEVGYRNGQRIRLALVPAPLSGDATGPLLAVGSVVLVTGGARGITAEAALELAQRYQPTLLLVGRTPLPVEPEPADTANLHDPPAIRRALIERHRMAATPASPAQIEDAYRKLLGAREVQANLARLRQTGARVEYFACDVRDPGAFGALIDRIYERYHRIDGVVHGAGIIEDKLVRDKKLESFERVMDTKVASAVTLAGKLRPDTLRFLALFSSFSGRFGNRGQGDYAAASEALNKLAQHLDRRWPGRVVSINWGPWLKTGMVSPEVQRQFAERGVALIPPALGCRMLDEELRLGRKGDVEVVIGGGTSPAGPAAPTPALPSAPQPAPSTRADTGAPSPVPASVSANEHGQRLERRHRALPLLAIAGSWSHTATGDVEMVRTLDPEQDVYLCDHRLDGRPVLPFAMALELMAEVAAAGWPDFEVAGLRAMHVLRGVVVGEEPPLLRVVARPQASAGAAAGGHSDLALDFSIVSHREPRLVHYRAVVDLLRRDEGGRARPVPRRGFEGAPDETGGVDVLAGAGPLPLSVPEAYRTWLFHGPLFQGIVAVEAIGPRGARATLRPSNLGECLRGGGTGSWLMDPVVVDSALQMNVIWGRLHWDMTLLPSGAAAYRRFGPLQEATIHHELRIRPESRAPICHADHYFYSSDGRLLAVLSDMQGTGSKALNRLALGSQQ